MAVCCSTRGPFRPVGASLTPVRARPELELDELWSFVGHKGQVVWVWLALERASRRIVGLAFGDRSADTRRELWNSLPADYRKRAICYTDEYEPYRLVLPSKRHRPLPKGSGATSLIERFNLTLRNWRANLNRKTLAVSQSAALHCTRIRLVINHYNSLHAGLW
jgi:insertion element IS1 protein InsB